jgi:hypothetical protein
VSSFSDLKIHYDFKLGFPPPSSEDAHPRLWNLQKISMLQKVLQL